VRHAVLLEVLTSRGVGTEILPRTARRSRAAPPARERGGSLTNAEVIRA